MKLKNKDTGNGNPVIHNHYHVLPKDGSDWGCCFFMSVCAVCFTVALIVEMVIKMDVK